MLTAGLTPRVTAEQAQNVTAARATAEKSLRAGRYDEIDTLAQAFPKDEAIAVYHALSVAARGDYARAESILQPFAAANAAGDAALETGSAAARRRQAHRRPPRAELVLMADVAQPDGARLSARRARVARAASHRRCAVVFPGRDGFAPNDPRVNTEWGELFLEKYDNAEAAKSFQDALKADRRLRARLLGMAQALADENPPQAVLFAQRVLKLNPNDAGAQLVLAEMAIYQDKKADVKDCIDRVLKFNPQHLEAMSMKAAMAYVEGGHRDISTRRWPRR